MTKTKPYKETCENCRRHVNGGCNLTGKTCDMDDDQPCANWIKK